MARQHRLFPIPCQAMIVFLLLHTRRLSDSVDHRVQSVPEDGVAPLLQLLPRLQDLTVYLHKPYEVCTRIGLQNKELLHPGPRCHRHASKLWLAHSLCTQHAFCHCMNAGAAAVRLLHDGCRAHLAPEGKSRPLFCACKELHSIWQHQTAQHQGQKMVLRAPRTRDPVPGLMPRPIPGSPQHYDETAPGGEEQFVEEVLQRLVPLEHVEHPGPGPMGGGPGWPGWHGPDDELEDDMSEGEEDMVGASWGLHAEEAHCSHKRHNVTPVAQCGATRVLRKEVCW